MNSFSVQSSLDELPFLPGKALSALRTAKFSQLGDLLWHLPRRYEDRNIFDRFPAHADGEARCLRGVVSDVRRRGGRGRMSYVEVLMVSGGDDPFGGRVTCRWFNMPYMAKSFAAGMEVIVYGKTKDFKGAVYLDHPEYEVVSDELEGDPVGIHTGRVVPVYPNISGIHQRELREIMWQALEAVDPAGLAATYDLDPTYPRAEVFRDLHFPESLQASEAARRYLAREEFFTLQLEVGRRKQRLQQEAGLVTARKTRLLREFYSALPFDLTGAQKRSIREIFEDMKSGHPMNRLLQGDVGSGKTFVALCASLLAVEAGFQVAVMAPTQILAEQHYLTFQSHLAKLGLRIALVTGSRRESAHIELEGQPQVIIGTHALLYDGVDFEQLGLVIIDEQHKFGVGQRKKLISRGSSPDLLVMTATPIPRTLTLSIYGDMEVSLIDEFPAGRGDIVTALRRQPKVTPLKEFLLTQLGKGRQVYLVFPLVEETESSSSQAATEAHVQWSQRLKGYQVGLLHGRMSSDEKEAVMNDFRDGHLQVLVSTTVIEVGVDVPNANTMVIWNAERFGLAQLHQLRGRIGRGSHKSYCILITEKSASDDAYQKLKVMERTRDGFEIAEEDLKLRGPGEVFGTLQSGTSSLRFPEFFADFELLREVRSLVDEFLSRPESEAPRPAISPAED